MSLAIAAKFAGTCITCEEKYDEGEAVNWEPNVGCWHGGCPALRNLSLYKKEAARRADAFNAIATPSRRS